MSKFAKHRGRKHLVWFLAPGPLQSIRRYTRSMRNCHTYVFSALRLRNKTLRGFRNERVTFEFTEMLCEPGSEACSGRRGLRQGETIPSAKTRMHRQAWGVVNRESCFLKRKNWTFDKLGQYCQVGRWGIGGQGLRLWKEGRPPPGQCQKKEEILR